LNQPPANLPTPREEPGVLLAVLLILLLAGILGVAFWLGFPNASTREFAGPGTVLGGIYLIVWALIFLASRFYAHKTFLFRWILRTSGRGQASRAKSRATFLFVVFMACGIAGVLAGTGLL
jgi:hypothetical protein